MHGEPLLNKDVCKIIKIFRGELLNSQLMLTTNGDVLINETKLKLNKLFESGLNVLAIDCYENYEKRRKLFNENKPNNIKFFDSNEFNIYYYHSIKTKCIVVFDSLPKLTKDMKKKIINCAGNSNEFFSNKYGYKIIEKPLEKKCSKPFREMVIKSNGNITFCCNDWKEELVLGNIKENLLENIWYSKKFIELRQRVFNKDRNFGEDDIALINGVLSELQSPIRNMHLYLMAKNLNRELLSKIEAKEKELSSRSSIQVSKGLEDHSQMIGISKNFLDIVQTAKKVAAQDFPILLEGNHGVGKKILARKIHTWSGRKGGCVVASCSAMSEAQLDREIFSSHGLLVQSNGGTLIIDDIGATTHHIQSKLLRALVSGEMITVDTEEKIPLNIRMIATSKTSLKELVEKGSFKEELFYRLNTLALKIPSLKERQDDIKVLAEFFLNSGKQQSKVLTSGAIEKLSNYFWPGNAHELKNIMERTYILTDGQYIEASHLPEFAQEVKVEEAPVVVKYQESTLFDLEKKHIIDTLDHLNGNKTRAAKALGITVKTLYNKLHSYGLIEARGE